YVPLAPITDADLVADSIALTMGTVVGARPALASVVSDICSAHAPTLLVLDNFEQVIDAASVVSELLAACPNLVVIVTSREVLHLYGEHVYTVGALALPDPAHVSQPEMLADCPSVALFVERAQAASPSFR